MNLWVIRAGRHGEREQICLDHGVAILGWDEMPDLSKYDTKEEMATDYPHYFDAKSANSVGASVGQLWRFAKEVKKGDLVAMPSKFQPVIYFGRVRQAYSYGTKDAALKGMPHSIGVEWIKPISRSEFEQDLLYSFGSLLTISQVSRNNAAERVKAILESSPKPVDPTTSPKIKEDIETESTIDIGEYAQSKIITHLQLKFKGHELTRLVDQILKAQGYVTTVSPPGPDGGIDILAGSGPLGFNNPKICVQVKSTDSQADVKIYRELIGVMSRFKAEFGLLVSWSGFNSSVQRESKEDFFKVRLWSANDVVEEIFKNYEKFSDEFKAELPLKKIWTLVEE